jgi:hypothetical protein
MHNQALVTVHCNGFSFFVCVADVAGAVSILMRWKMTTRSWTFSVASSASSSFAFSASTKLTEISSVTSTSFEIFFVSILGANETSEALAEPAPLPLVEPAVEPAPLPLVEPAPLPFVEPAVELAPVPLSSRDWPTRLGAWQRQWQC